MGPDRKKRGKFLVNRGAVLGGLRIAEHKVRNGPDVHSTIAVPPEVAIDDLWASTH
jgi:hypothetical protein